MTRLTILFTAFVLTLQYGYTQGFVNKSKKKVKQLLENQRDKNTVGNIQLEETGSAIHYLVRGPGVLPGDFIYTFDTRGKCIAETATLNCDSCFQKFLQNALARKEYRWKKLNDHAYVSTYYKKLMLEISSLDTPHSFIIRRMKWSREDYKTLLANK